MRLKLAAALMALPLLAACAPEIESTIYTRDIDDALESGKPLAILATLKVPQTGSDTCTESLPKLVENLGKLTPIKGAGKCIEDDGNAFAELETTMMIEPTGVSADPQPLFAVLLQAGTVPGSHDLVFAMSMSLGDIVAAVDPDQSSTDFDPAKFTLTVSNDGSDTVSLIPGEVFLDGRPMLPGSGSVVLERRHDATIVLSDVASGFLTEGKSYRFATLVPQ